ncbi:MAG: hypothetical protein EZS28_005271 [Streblomastix strix]|uniref:DNA-directed DNA polymerase n=1 Tax=Streblomastix strix TaxID=222440 RepID=A0A5J4WW54_9EUKA|nr:MAG: hypothetical protein EZS28_005271 [Streblomastix strix]
MDLSRIAEAKRIFQRVNGFEFRNNYQGFNFVSYIDNFNNKEQINVHMYAYHSDPSDYELTQNYTVDGSDMQFNILFINDGINAHIMYISDVEALTGFRYCNICHRQAFRIGDKNLQVQMRNHMKKYQKNNAKIVKKVILERFAKLFVPHILSNKTYKYLLAKSLIHLFQPTQYYITYDIETLEKKVNEKFGDYSQIIAILVPYLIASTVKSISGIHSFYYDIRTDDFMDKWLKQLFEEAKQVKKDNKYKDETIPQYFEMPLIGFNSAKFDTSLVYKNLKSKDWTITKYLGSSTIAKQFVVKHKRFGVQLRFIDFKIYTEHTRLKDCVRDFGIGTYEKGIFAHEFVNVNNQIDELNKGEPFLIEVFDNKLRNKQISEDNYKEYLVEDAKFKTCWDYLKHYNILDTLILIEPIDFLNNLMFRYKFDILANISIAQCANAIKYSMCYSDFDINGNYNYESTNKSIDITQYYWNSKVESNIEQDSKKGLISVITLRLMNTIILKKYSRIGDATYVTYDSYVRIYLHQIGQIIVLVIRNQMFSPAVCTIILAKANRDENQMKLMIQLRKYALFKQLPMTLISDNIYKIVRRGITGELSTVILRCNIAGETRINHYEYDKENKCVYLIDSDNVMTYVIQLDFDSQYPSVMSSETHPFIPYTCNKIQMCGQAIEFINATTQFDQDGCNVQIYDTNRFSNDPLVVDKMLLFIAEVRGHIDEYYINYCIDFGPILHNIDITTNKETIGEYMYNHLVEHNLPYDIVERKLTNLVDMNNEVMSFNNYYLWLLIDQFHFITDVIVSVTTFTKHDGFNSFVKEFIYIRYQAKQDKNDGLAQFAKIVLNSSFGGDALNSEMYSSTKLLSANKTFMLHMLSNFIKSAEWRDDLYAVQIDKENFRCNTCIKCAFFTLDNAKFLYINFLYNFLFKAFDRTKMRTIQLDTDSLTLAIAGNSRDFTQGLDAIIKDPEFYNKNKGFFFSEIGQRKILGVHIEKQSYLCIALSPKNYIINDEIVLKGVKLDQNPQINEQTFIDNFTKEYQEQLLIPHQHSIEVL